MAPRSRKVATVARLLGAASGVPFVREDHGRIEMPEPYSAVVFTGRGTGEKYNASLRSMPHRGVPMHIHYSAETTDSVGDAVVSMRLSDFAPLLGAHYEANVAGRSE